MVRFVPSFLSCKGLNVVNCHVKIEERKHSSCRGFKVVAKHQGDFISSLSRDSLSRIDG